MLERILAPEVAYMVETAPFSIFLLAAGDMTSIKLCR